MIRLSRPLLLVVLAVAIPVVFWIGSALVSRSLPLEGGPPSDGLVRLAGAVHVHTSLSDGAGTPEDVVQAGREAGLSFLALTDHNNDAALSLDGYHDGVLVLVGTEISTYQGHLLGLGMRPMTFPPARDARNALDDVRYLGGAAFVAHPTSPRDDLAWSGWEIEDPWGLEVLNMDSLWRRASWLTWLRGLAAYPFDPAYALAHGLDRPDAAIARWDESLRRRNVAGLAGVDAHGRSRHASRERKRLVRSIRHILTRRQDDARSPTNSLGAGLAELRRAEAGGDGVRVRIGIDGKVLTLRAGGTGRYAINLMRALFAEAAAHRDLEFVVFTGPQTSADIMEEFSGACDLRYLGLEEQHAPFAGVGSQSRSRRLRTDIFHGLDHVGIPLIGRTGKYVVTIHDLIPLLLPQTFTLRHRMVVRTALAQVRRKADLVIVPSHAVKRDVVQHLGLGEDRVVVTYHGCEPRFHPAADEAAFRAVTTKHGLPSRYVLAVGTLEPRKNLVTLLRAFACLQRTSKIDPDLRLLLAGGRGWLE